MQQQPISYTNVRVEDRRFSFRRSCHDRSVLLADHILDIVVVGSTVRWGDEADNNWGYVAETEDKFHLRGFKFLPAVTLGLGTDPKELVQTLEDFDITVNDVYKVVIADHYLEMTSKTQYYFKRLYAANAHKIHDIKNYSVKDRIHYLDWNAMAIFDANFFTLREDAGKEISKFLAKRSKRTSGKSVTIPRVPFSHYCCLANMVESNVDMKRAKNSYSFIIKEPGHFHSFFGGLAWWTHIKGTGVMEGIFPVTVSYNLKESSMRISFKDLVFKTVNDYVVWDTRKRKRGAEEAEAEPEPRRSKFFHEIFED